MLAVYFSGKNSLDSKALRLAVLRIPQVLGRLREVQKIIDSSDEVFDLHNFMLSDDSVFFANAYARHLSVQVVLLGLYDRFSRRSEAGFLIGSDESYSAFKVVTQGMSVDTMVSGLKDQHSKRRSHVVQIDSPVLAGSQLNELIVVERAEEKYSKLSLRETDLARLLKSLFAQKTVTDLVHLGPDDASVLRAVQVLSENQIRVNDIMDGDENLVWFWPSIKEMQILCA